MSYNISADFFVSDRPYTNVPCLRAYHDDGTFIQLSHRSPIAFPLPFFAVRMDDDETLYALRVKILAEDRTHDKLGKWFEHNGERYEVFYDHSDTPFMTRLAHHNHATYYHTCCGVSLVVDDKNIFTVYFDGKCNMSKDMTRHQWNCLKTFCRDFGNDMT